ncbi:MAG: sigma-54-dependent Fis family transcriptional regulator, partial [Deltaproteobacteria bacterium]|nr:sigma-54-dependent Fis family transcriptional regulator [Deltaproteobacteria bacterium]
DAEIASGRFREDLYYRLNVIPIHLPPLRERFEQLPLLGQFFLDQYLLEYGKSPVPVDKEVWNLLGRYSWPGNVRELEHTVERAVLLGKGDRIAATDLPPQLLAQGDRESTLAEALARHYTLRALEQEYIKKVMLATGGNKTEAATILGVDRTTLYRKLEEAKGKG